MPCREGLPRCLSPTVVILREEEVPIAGWAGGAGVHVLGWLLGWFCPQVKGSHCHTLHWAMWEEQKGRRGPGAPIPEQHGARGGRSDPATTGLPSGWAGQHPCTTETVSYNKGSAYLLSACCMPGTVLSSLGSFTF